MKTRIRNALFGLMSGLLSIGAMTAQAEEVITFDPLEIAGAGQTPSGPYSESGFTITNISLNQTGSINSWQQSYPHYAGSAGIWVNYGNATARLTANSGDPFSLHSVDLSLRYDGLYGDSESAIVPFTGYLVGGGTVTTSFERTDFGFETFTFDSSWTNLTEVRFSNTNMVYGCCAAQFDNFVLTVAGQDSDGDGVNDEEDNCPDDANTDQTDSDGDFIGDECDSCALDADNDADEDGVCGDVDNCPTVVNTDQTNSDGQGAGDACIAGFDNDGDFWENQFDNCADIENSDQANEDGDALGDVCDSCPLDEFNDSDGDGFCADADNCPTTANSDQIDTDNDMLGNACDPDDDGDGVGDGDDNCPLQANANQADFDIDGEGDACDFDDDGDNVVDAGDSCPMTEANALVNAEGCALAQLCPCDGEWRNHGKYVSCVAHAANDFRDVGLINDDEHGVIVSEAGQSSCGHRN